MKRTACFGVLLAILTACGVSQSEIDSKEADVRERGFTITSSGDGGIGGEIYVHVSFGGNNKCNGTIWYNNGAVTLQAKLTVPGSAVKGEFSVDNPRASMLPKVLASTDCFR